MFGSICDRTKLPKANGLSDSSKCNFVKLWECMDHDESNTHYMNLNVIYISVTVFLKVNSAFYNGCVI